MRKAQDGEDPLRFKGLSSRPSLIIMADSKTLVYHFKKIELERVQALPCIKFDDTYHVVLFSRPSCCFLGDRNFSWGQRLIHVQSKTLLEAIIVLLLKSLLRETSQEEPSSLLLET